MTPTPAADRVAEIVLTNAGLRVLDSAGAVSFEVGGNDWSDDLLAALTDEHGTPEVSETPISTHEFPTTVYSWGGLFLAQVHYDSGPGTRVTLGAAGLPAGVVARTEGGVTLQTSYDDLLARATTPPYEFDYDGTARTAFYIEGDGSQAGTDGCYEAAIYVVFDRTSSRVENIVAPDISCRP